MTDTPDPKYCDLFGREYARLSQLKAGDTVETDGDFDCLVDPETGNRKARVTVIDCGGGQLGFACNEGSHTFDGQLMDDDQLIGIYPVDMTPRGAKP